MQREENLARFLDNSLRQICEYLGLHPQWHMSSELNKNNSLRGQEKVLAICEELRATHYINAPGGKGLYDRTDFLCKGLELLFIQPHPVAYRQFRNQFVPNLSIIDVMMFNEQKECNRLLGEYSLA